MTKLPWMQFFTGDWLKDPKLSMCLPATRGIWIDAIAAMHENGRTGTLSGTADQLIRILRCDGPALVAALSDLQSTGAADITYRNSVITLKNRRMEREAIDREHNRLRQERYRDNGKVTEGVTPMSLLTSISVSLFDVFYKAYPRKEGRKQAEDEFAKSGITEEMMPGILQWIEQAKQSEQWSEAGFIPHPSTWLHQRRWEGDPPPPAKKKKSSKADTVGAPDTNGGNTRSVYYGQIKLKPPEVRSSDEKRFIELYEKGDL